MAMARPVIALLTDFGMRDHYVGTMKGVMLGICPDITFVDISHDLAPHDVLAGALELAAAYRYFPVGTTFLVVVDPGVGSIRRGLAVEAGDYKFVAPDNGVLTPVFEDHPTRRVVELLERRYARATVSRTFEGRDRFAPAAAWLAKGIELPALGRPVPDAFRLELPVPEAHAERITGQVTRVDRFGNLITNVDRRAFEKLTGGGPVDIRVGPHGVSKLVSTYADIPGAEVCALFGSTDHLEIAANGVSAARALDLDRGAAVHITRRA
jgi:S-adenosylmethionine hydrolase